MIEEHDKMMEDEGERKMRGEERTGKSEIIEERDDRGRYIQTLRGGLITAPANVSNVPNKTAQRSLMFEYEHLLFARCDRAVLAVLAAVDQTRRALFRQPAVMNGWNKPGQPVRSLRRSCLERRGSPSAPLFHK